MKNNKIIHESFGDRVFNVVNLCLLTIVILIILYPIYFLVIASISDPTYVNLGQTLLLPKGITLLGYKKLLEFPQILTGYKNSIIYTVVGTSINLVTCVLAAFSLSRRELPGRRLLNVFFVITMYFSGGLIPTYLVVKNLGMTDSIWAVILPNALNAYYLIVCRSFFEGNISEELFEATKVDGGGYFTFFFKVVLPLSGSIVAVMVLYHALIHWNSYLNALYYLRDSKKYPLQLILRSLTETLSTADQSAGDATAITEQIKMRQSVRYSLILVAAVPVFIIYPFVQKYFVTGVMVGSVKG